MNYRRTVLVAFLGVSILALALGAFSQGERRFAGPTPVLADEGQGSSQTSGARADDEAAVRALSNKIAKAMEKRDAKAIAASWTPEGEFIGMDGTSVRGRDAVEQAFAKYFDENTGLHVELKIDSIRFLSKENALEEGMARTWSDTSKQPVSKNYSVLYVRENGKWLVALAHEWAAKGNTLHELDWLIGNWTAKTEDATIDSNYQWDVSKKFILMHFTIQRKGQNLQGMEMIGVDPRSGQLRSWLFLSDGGFGQAVWTWDENHWIMQANGTEGNGTEMTATNILKPIDNDSFTWQSTQRALDGDSVPSTPPVKVTRVK